MKKNTVVMKMIIITLLLGLIITSKLLIDSYKRIGDSYYRTYRWAFDIYLVNTLIPVLNDNDSNEYDVSLLDSSYNIFILSIAHSDSENGKYENAMYDFKDELFKLSIMMRNYGSDNIKVNETKVRVIEKANELRELYKELEGINGRNNLKWYFYFR